MNYAISHMADFDGLASAALLARAFGIRKDNIFFSGYAGSEFEIAKQMLLAKNPRNSRIIIADIGVDESHAHKVASFYKVLKKRGNTIIWIDHHKCSERSLKAVRPYIDFALFGENKYYCAAEIIYRLFLRSDKTAKKIAGIAHKTDFNLGKDKDIANRLSYAITRINYEKNYMEILRDLAIMVSKGKIENSIVDKFYKKYLKEEKEGLLLLRKSMRINEKYGFAIGFSRRLDNNVACNTLRKWSGKGLVVYINREKDKVSIRSTNGEAEKIARLLGGGGHENAAGADVKWIGKEEEKAYEKIEKIIRKVEQK